MNETQATPRAMIDQVRVWCAHDDIVAVSALTAHPKNNNTHPARQVELLAKIIRENGWRGSITVSERSGYITKGHGRLLAAKHAGMDRVPVEYQGYLSE